MRTIHNRRTTYTFLERRTVATYSLVWGQGQVEHLHRDLCAAILQATKGKLHRHRRIASLPRTYRVQWRPEEGVAFAFNEDRASHQHHPFWIGIGLDDPAAVRHGALPAFPTQFNTDGRGASRLAGAFLRADDGTIHLGHSGRLKRCKVDDVLDAYPGPVVHVTRRGRQTTDRFMLIGRLRDPNLCGSLRAFGEFAKDFKTGFMPGQASKVKGAEFSGRAIVGPRPGYEADYQHGRVVEALRRYVARKGVRVWRTQLEDLLVGGTTARPHYLLEVKTEAALQPVYTALGQLQYHAARYSPRPGRVIVLPSDVPARIRRALDVIGVRTILFEEVGRKVNFRGADALLR